MHAHKRNQRLNIKSQNDNEKVKLIITTEITQKTHLCTSRRFEAKLR